MSLFSKVFDQLDHAAKPLLSAAAKWAETDGLTIVRGVEQKIKAQAPAALVATFNKTLGSSLGVTLPPGSTLSADATNLLITAMARAEAESTSGAKLRSSVLNAGIEQAVLLLKGAAGDTTTTPAPMAQMAHK